MNGEGARKENVWERWSRAQKKEISGKRNPGAAVDTGRRGGGWRERELWIVETHKGRLCNVCHWDRPAQKQTNHVCIQWFHWFLYFMVKCPRCSHILIINREYKVHWNRLWLNFPFLPYLIFSLLSHLASLKLFWLCVSDGRNRIGTNRKSSRSLFTSSPSSSFPYFASSSSSALNFFLPTPLYIYKKRFGHCRLLLDL